MNVFEKFFEIASANPLIIGTFGIVCGLVGHLITNWLSVDRDRRKEFNEAATRLHVAWSRNNRINPHDLFAFQSRLRFWNRRRFSKALAAHNAESANYKVDEIGGWSYADPEAFERTRQRVISFTKLR